MKNNLDIQLVDIETLIADQSGSRGIDIESQEGLKFSLEKFGYVSLIVVNRLDNRIVAGNQRFLILKESGIKEIPVLMIDLCQEDYKTLSICLNSESISGFWTSYLNELIKNIKANHYQDYLSLRLEDLQLNSNVVDYFVDKRIKEREIDETLKVDHECPKCRYVW